MKRFLAYVIDVMDKFELGAVLAKYVAVQEYFAVPSVGGEDTLWRFASEIM